MGTTLERHSLTAFCGNIITLDKGGHFVLHLNADIEQKTRVL